MRGVASTADEASDHIDFVGLEVVLPAAVVFAVMLVGRIAVFAGKSAGVVFGPAVLGNHVVIDSSGFAAPAVAVLKKSFVTVNVHLNSLAVACAADSETSEPTVSHASIDGKTGVLDHVSADAYSGVAGVNHANVAAPEVVALADVALADVAHDVALAAVALADVALADVALATVILADVAHVAVALDAVVAAVCPDKTADKSADFVLVAIHNPAGR